MCVGSRYLITHNAKYGIEISVLALGDLKANKRASGRGKDLGDLESLE